MGSQRKEENGMVLVQTKNGWKYEKSIKPEDLLKDDVVYEAAEKIKALQAEMKAVNAEIRESISSYLEIIAEKYGIKLGGEKGGVSLSSIDGRYRLTLSRNGRISIDDSKLSIAKSLINEFLDDLTKDSSSELKILVNSAFRTDEKGSAKVREILNLRSVNIDDPRWKKAMDVISDGIDIVDSRPYLKMYEIDTSKEGSSPEYIRLDFSVM